jgi:hypothetical protein
VVGLSKGRVQLMAYEEIDSPIHYPAIGSPRIRWSVNCMC